LYQNRQKKSSILYIIPNIIHYLHYVKMLQGFVDFILDFRFSSNHITLTIGLLYNPMVGASVACAVAVQEAMTK